MHKNLKPNSQPEGAECDTLFETLLEDVALSILKSNWHRVNTYKNKGLPETADWVKTIIRRNVLPGRKIRKKIVEDAYEHIAENPSADNRKLATILGWCLEIWQAYILILDDIVDKSPTRVNQPCGNNVIDSITVNDAALIKGSVFEILEKYLKNSPFYKDLLMAFHDAGLKTGLAQIMNTVCCTERSFDRYTTAFYNSMVNHKTSYYSFYLPLKLALLLGGVPTSGTENRQLWTVVESVSKLVGKNFQIQNDVLNCFGNKNGVTKIGNDIEEGKCTWLFVRAKELCTPEELDLLQSNYGIHEEEKIRSVKELYTQLGLQHRATQCLEEICESMTSCISKIEHRGIQDALLMLVSQARKGY